MPRRQANNTDRRRKISLQNDYAFCIINPVSPTVLPNPTYSPALSFILPYGGISGSSIPTIEIEYAEEAYKEQEAKNSASEGFRRWSFCNFQQSGQPVVANVPDGTASVFSSDEGGLSSAASDSSSSLNWMSNLLSNIPERIRKLSTGKNKFDAVQSMQENQEIHKQMRKMVVY